MLSGYNILDLQPEIISEIISCIYDHHDRYTDECQIFNLCQISKKLCLSVISSIPHIRYAIVFSSRFVDLFRGLRYLSIIRMRSCIGVNLGMFNPAIFSNLVRLEISSAQAIMFRKPGILDEMFDQSKYRLNRPYVPILYNLEYLKVVRLDCVDKHPISDIDNTRFPKLREVSTIDFIISNITDFQTISSLHIEYFQTISSLYIEHSRRFPDIPRNYLTGTGESRSNISKLSIDICTEDETYILDIQDITSLTIYSSSADMKFVGYQNLTDLQCPLSMLEGDDSNLNIQQMTRLEGLKIVSEYIDDVKINANLYPRSLKYISISSSYRRTSNKIPIVFGMKFKAFEYCRYDPISREHRRLLSHRSGELYPYSEIYILRELLRENLDQSE